jgi:hypothetical protein
MVTKVGGRCKGLESQMHVDAEDPRRSSAYGTTQLWPRSTVSSPTGTTIDASPSSAAVAAIRPD